MPAHSHSSSCAKQRQRLARVKLKTHTHTGRLGRRNKKKTKLRGDVVGRVRKVNTINSTSGSAAKTDRLHHQLGLQHYEDRQERTFALPRWSWQSDTWHPVLLSIWLHKVSIVNRTILQCKLRCERRQTHKHMYMQASLLERAACLGLTCSLSLVIAPLRSFVRNRNHLMGISQWFQMLLSSCYSAAFASACFAALPFVLVVNNIWRSLAAAAA